MRKFNAVLVLADISGYTKFVVLNRTSIMHAEQIITDLMEVVTRNTAHPLRIEKLEGDAAFMSAEIGSDPEAAVRDVMKQVVSFMALYRDKQRELFDRSIGGCMCSACQSIENLNLKCIVHTGEIVEKPVSGGSELAGEAVILCHRLAKNKLQSDSYVLVTQDIDRCLGSSPFRRSMLLTEEVEHFGSVPTKVYFPDGVDMERPNIKPLTRVSGLLETARLFSRGLSAQLTGRKTTFSHLPK